MINRLIDSESGFISPQSARDFRFINGSREGLRIAEDNGLSIFVISNQPDVSKDWRSLSREELEKIDHILKDNGVEKVYNCTHGPLNGAKNKTYTNKKGEIITCNCRKPQTGLIERCFRENDLEIGRSLMVGDKKTDMMAARRFELSKGSYFHSKIRIGENQGLCDKKMNNLKEVVENTVG